MRSRAALKAIYRPVTAMLLRAVAWTFRRMPRRLALAIGEGMGLAAFRLIRRDRGLAMTHLRLAFGRTKPRRELARIARESFRNLGRSAAETMRLSAMTEDDILSLVDADAFTPVEEVLARGEGLIALLAHIGAWEIQGAYLALRIGKPFHAVARKIYYAPYNDLVSEVRDAMGIKAVFQEAGARPVLRVLRANRTIAILGDQDVPKLNGVFVDFFGRPAWTPTGPAALSRASGAAIVPMFITWKGLRHRLHVFPEIEPLRTRDKHADIAEITRRWTAAVEDIVRAYPEQWPWFHRRWRTRPEDKPTNVAEQGWT